MTRLFRYCSKFKEFRKKFRKKCGDFFRNAQ